jgi:opacity protein-like surface antigen
MRALTLSLALLVLMLALAPVASAEWFADFYLGPAITGGSDVTFELFNRQQTQKLNGRSSPEFGLRFGRWLDDFNLWWLGAAVDVSYFRPAIDVQTVPISLLAMARYGFFKDDEFPKGRLQPYVGIGPGLFFSIASGNIGSLTVDDTSTDIGLDFRTGVAFQFDPNWAAFLEYRFTHIEPSWSANVFGTNSSASTTFNTNHILLGVSYRF